MSARIVLADDSITIQKVIGLTFASEDYALQSFDNGTEALDSIQARMPDLVIADTDMPGLNGFELCAEVKKLSPHTPVILLHTTYEAFDSVRAQSVGADHASPKPFDSAELLGHIRRLLQNTGSAAASVVEDIAEVEPLEEIEEISELEDSAPETAAAPATRPSFAALEDESGLLASDAFGELGDGDIVTADALETPEESTSQDVPVGDSVAEHLDMPEELPHDLEALEAEPDEQTQPPAVATVTTASAIWNLSGVEPYSHGATATPEVIAAVPSDVEAGPFGSQDHDLAGQLAEPETDESSFAEPLEAIEDVPLAPGEELRAPHSATAEPETEPEFGAPADFGASEEPEPSSADLETTFEADLPPVEPVADDNSSFTSIADSMYDMAGMDAVVQPSAPVAAQAVAEVQEPSRSTAAMMDDFEAFAASAEEPIASESDESTPSDPFSAFAEYAEQAPAPAPGTNSGSDPFAAFAATEGDLMGSDASTVPSEPTAAVPPPAQTLAVAAVAPPSEEQVRAAVADQVRHLVQTEMADQIRTAVHQAVERALEDILAQLRERLRLP